MSPDFDVAIVGSGPTGALSASRLVARGLRVLMLDGGHDDDHYRELVPDRPFSEIRRTDPRQRRYLLGDREEGIPRGEVRVGAQLTPPRQFVTEAAERHLPYRGDGFDPMQSLALGGLGAAWGAAAFTFTDAEIERVGLRAGWDRRYYDDVAQIVGVSGDPSDPAGAEVFDGVPHHLPPLELDSAGRYLWRRSLERAEDLRRHGLLVGRTPLAVLSRDLGERRANPYFDMDFWSESRRSVFRPRYLVEALGKEPNFLLESGRLVTHFQEGERDGVTIATRGLRGQGPAAYRARRLLLCAGAIGSARIALNSLDRVEERVPILCNPYTYVPSLCWPLLGGAAEDRRHSLSQLIAIYKPEEDPEDCVSAQFYGYRSLLLFKLVKEMPLPPWAGLQVARLLMNGLVIVGVHHSDTPAPEKTMRILSRERECLPTVAFDHRPGPAERQRRRRRERALGRLLARNLRLVPIQRIDPGPASSIHYAGTIPFREAEEDGWGAAPDGRLHRTRNVYLGDGSTWRHLPAKGLTFTLMANALRVADALAAGLGASG